MEWASPLRLSYRPVSTKSPASGRLRLVRRALRSVRLLLFQYFVVRFPRLRQLLLEHAVLFCGLIHEELIAFDDDKSRCNSASRFAAFLSCFCSFLCSRSFSESRAVSSACKRDASTCNRALDASLFRLLARLVQDLEEAPSNSQGDSPRRVKSDLLLSLRELGALPRGDHGGREGDDGASPTAA